MRSFLPIKRTLDNTALSRRSPVSLNALNECRTGTPDHVFDDVQESLEQEGESLLPLDLFSVHIIDADIDLTSALVTACDHDSNMVNNEDANTGMLKCNTYDETLPPPRCLSSAISVWQGSVCISGKRERMAIKCIAVSHAVAGLPRIQDVSTWPSTMVCTTEHMLHVTDLKPKMEQNCLRWLVRIVPINDSGHEIFDSRLSRVAQVLEEKEVMFQVRCGASANQMDATEFVSDDDSIYIMGSAPYAMAPSLFGVYCCDR